jgi:hypothetical protein
LVICSDCEKKHFSNSKRKDWDFIGIWKIVGRMWVALCGFK